MAYRLRLELLDQLFAVSTSSHHVATVGALLLAELTDDSASLHPTAHVYFWELDPTTDFDWVAQVEVMSLR
jgi:hypothetical protein